MQVQALHDDKRDKINTFKELFRPKKNDSIIRDDKYWFGYERG